MQVDSVSSSTTTTSATTTSSTKSSSASLVDNYQSFLTLLLKQLEVQDPTNPVDASQYTTQLVQLSTLEQQISNGEKLDDLTTAVSQLGFGTSAIGYLGRTVEADGDTTALQDGAASWEYDLESDAKTVALTVRDESGSVVYRGTGETGQGTHSFTWDGKGSDGKTYTSGNFTLSVDALDSSKAAVTTDIRMKGKVTSVDTSGDTAQLGIGGVTVSAESVLALS